MFDQSPPKADPFAKMFSGTYYSRFTFVETKAAKKKNNLA
jgi:hypothetical protein